MLANFLELLNYRELLWVWTDREVRIRYKQTFFGAAWAVFQPVMMMIAFTIIAVFFRGRIENDGVPYPIFYFSALLPWSYFSTSVTASSTTMITNLSLVTKSYFPREILPIAKVGSSLFDFLMALIVFGVMVAIYRFPVHWSYLWVFPLMAILTLLALGLSFFLSAVIVQYRDIRHLVPTAMQMLLFLSPIIYPTAQIPGSIRTYYLILNPIAAFVDSFRRVLLYGMAPGSYMIGTLVISLIVFFFGYNVLKKLEKNFADII
jgi:lipopolysaccharide transport system permease protein